MFINSHLIIDSKRLLIKNNLKLFYNFFDSSTQIRKTNNLDNSSWNLKRVRKHPETFRKKILCEY